MKQPFLISMVFLLATLLTLEAGAKQSVIPQHLKIEVDKKKFDVRVLEIDLKKVRLKVGLAQDQVGKTEELASIAKRHGAIAAINGTFFDAYTKDATKMPDGTLISAGKMLNEFLIGTVFAYHSDGSVSIGLAQSYQERDAHRLQSVQEALGAGPRLLTKGEITLAPMEEGFSDPKILSGTGSRSVLGIRKDGKLLLVVASDKMMQLAQIIKKLGAVDAMNLDGGASSGLWLKGKFLRKPGRAISNSLLILEK